MPPKGKPGPKPKPKLPIDPNQVASSESSKSKGKSKNVDSIEFYELPKANVVRLARAAIGPGVIVGGDVPLALQQSSTVFISYLAAIAQEEAQANKVKTISANHVLEAVKKLGWEDSKQLSKLLKAELKAFRQAAADKKANKPPPVPGAIFGRGRPSAATIFARSQAELELNNGVIVEEEEDPNAVEEIVDNSAYKDGGEEEEEITEAEMEAEEARLNREAEAGQQDEDVEMS